MKKYIFFLLAILIFGCATDKDLKSVQRNLDQKIFELKDDYSVLRKDVKEYTEANRTLRENQAETGADMIGLRDDVRELRGVVEKLSKNVMTDRKDNKPGENVTKKLSDISFRVNYVESFLGIGKPEGPEKNITKDVTKKKISKEATYAAAYETFKEGKYDRARKQFQKFLKLFPNTEYSDNAQFWIGECYFFEKEYEKAILEYEKAINKYPRGNKVSYALLKQGMSFLKLGDKQSAKLLLQQVIKDFPNTNQARIARAKLPGIN